jgi:hypothetical protein
VTQRKLRNDYDEAKDNLLLLCDYAEESPAIECVAVDRIKAQIRTSLDTCFALAIARPTGDETEAAYREGFQDGAEWARDDSETSEDSYWRKSQALAQLEERSAK